MRIFGTKMQLFWKFSILFELKVSSWSSVKFSAQNRKICDDWLLDSRIFSVNNC